MVPAFAVTNLKNLMAEEATLLANFFSREEEVKKAVEFCDWKALETLLSELQPLAEAIEKTETLRHEAFSELRSMVGEPEDAGFYQVAVKLLPKDRDECALLYRNLKVTVVRLQALTFSIDGYVKAVSGTMQQVLNEVFPYRKGRIYSKAGGPKRDENLGPLVLNTER
jgi:hypothetical protein